MLLFHRENAPVNMDPSLWIRLKIPTLDQEIIDGNIFSFCLAGLNKIWEDSKVPDIYKGKSIGKILNIKTNIYEVQDGVSNLLASMGSIQENMHPIFNITFGTDIAFGATDNEGHIMPPGSFKRSTGKSFPSFNSWRLSLNCWNVILFVIFYK